VIPLALPARSDAASPYVAQLRCSGGTWRAANDAVLVAADADVSLFAGQGGLLEIKGVPAEALDGDVVLVEPEGGRVERLLRAGSPHNTLLITERCDQLCLMCSQPPKKTHVDRFAAFEEACLLAEPGAVIGLSGGEPTLFKEQIFALVEGVHESRPDIGFHILSNGQHFEAEDVSRLREPAFANVEWGIPLYAAEPSLHDIIVHKVGAYERLHRSFAWLLLAGANVELRTVVLTHNVAALPALARHVAAKLGFARSWSIMQLENIGFARNRWANLYFDHRDGFAAIASAVDEATLHGVAVRLFNFARCSVPTDYRPFAAASISDWKRRYAPACERCREKHLCSGFFEWHPGGDAAGGVEPL
jgi:His-Xaa-Ser system radical SAM maturase HxsC